MLSRELWSGRLPGSVTVYLRAPMQPANEPARAHRPPPSCMYLGIWPRPFLWDGCDHAVEQHSSAIRASPEQMSPGVFLSGAALCPGLFPRSSSSASGRLTRLPPTQASLRDAVAAVARGPRESRGSAVSA